MIAIVGCGNTNRSDDGAGPCVIRALRAEPDLGADSEVMLLDAGTDGIAVMFAARGCDELIVVDACQPEGNPGAIHEVEGLDLDEAHEPALNLHDFRWDHALHAGRRIYGDGFADNVTIFLIEAETLEPGLDLSPPVEEAVGRLARRAADRLRMRRAAMEQVP